jgi:hypothetical protein
MDADQRLDQRLRVHRALASRLAGMSDAALAALLTESDPSRASLFGNASEVIEVDGAKVFVKKIALTELERSAGEGATANLFDLPLFCRYELGFGAWRELSACLRASDWALSGECVLFPLVHHWRVLPRTPTPGNAELEARLQRALDYWDRSEAIAARVEALWGATASLVLFLEYVPKMLLVWLADRSSESTDAAMETAILRFHDEWRRAAAFMNERGMLHFDLHRANLLTDGAQIYVADYGLALCADFDLAPAEREFFEAHRLYDRGYVDWAFRDWLRLAEPPLVMTPAIEARLESAAPVADVFARFINSLNTVSKETPFPTAEMESVRAAAAEEMGRETESA